MRQATTYVPDELWYNPERDHFEFDDKNHRGVAVMKDGRRIEFDSTVTQEMIDADREKWLTEMRARAARGECVFEEFEFKTAVPAFHGQLVNFTS